MLVFAVTASILSGASQLFAGGLCTKPSVAHAPQTVHNTTNYNFAEGSTGVVNPTAPVTVHQHGSRSSSHSSRSREGQAARGRTTARQTAGSHRGRPVTPRDRVTSRRASAESGRRNRDASRATAGHKSDSDDGDDIPAVATFDLEATAEERRVAFRSPVSIISPTHQRTPDSADFPSPETAARKGRQRQSSNRVTRVSLTQSPVARAPRKSAPARVAHRRPQSPELRITNLEAAESPAHSGAGGTGETPSFLPGAVEAAKYAFTMRDEKDAIFADVQARQGELNRIHSLLVESTSQNFVRIVQGMLAHAQTESKNHTGGDLLRFAKFDVDALAAALKAAQAIDASRTPEQVIKRARTQLIRTYMREITSISHEFTAANFGRLFT